MKKIFVFALSLVATLSAAPAHSKTWTLENTPKEFRPKLCADVRAALARDRSSASYKYAMQRKAEGKMWRRHKERLAESSRIDDSYRRLDCKRY